MELSLDDSNTLKGLATEIADIARLSVHAEKAELWRRLNDLEPVRPLVWINEIPWHEMNADDELTLRCENDWARRLEDRLRREIYQWRHMPGDMIVNDTIECPLVIHSTGLGVEEDADIVSTDPNSNIVSRHFNPRIENPEDIAIIRDPVVTFDAQATEDHFDTMRRLFGDIIAVKKTGKKHFWFTPWDNLIRVWGVEQAMIDLVDRPEMVNAIVDRFVEASLRELEQYERLNLLALGSNNTRVGSGGYGYTKDLPGDPYDPERVRPHNMWGCSNAQIFSEVSPDMHWEFALRHDFPWLEKWGPTYYGCCEPLDFKLDILHKVPNLRKISMSPRADMERAAKEVGRDYVISRKPNPAILAETTWRPEQARKELREALEIARGLQVEVIMKDISTVNYEPQRLWEWERIATEEAASYE
jgi:hypothetical protein